MTRAKAKLPAVISKAGAKFRVPTNRLMAVGDMRLIFSLLAVLVTTSVKVASAPVNNSCQPGGAQTGPRRFIRAAITYLEISLLRHRRVIVELPIVLGADLFVNCRSLYPPKAIDR
jgi:hypothetical protein